MRIESRVVAAGRPETPGAPVNTPIVLTAPYRNDPEDNFYSRATPTETRAALEAVLGELDGGRALAFGSGMAALSTVVNLQPVGAKVVVPDAAYSGAVGIFAHAEKTARLSVRTVDIADTDAVIAALDGGAALLWLETMTNPLLAVPDLPVLIEAAHAAGAMVGIDATFSTPLNVRPLDLGADVVMHSATKYLAGHSDVLMGVLTTTSDELYGALCARWCCGWNVHRPTLANSRSGSRRIRACSGCAIPACRAIPGTSARQGCSPTTAPCSASRSPGRPTMPKRCANGCD
jgi:cystathionine gamma-synthase